MPEGYTAGSRHHEQALDAVDAAGAVAGAAVAGSGAGASVSEAQGGAAAAAAEDGAGGGDGHASLPLAAIRSEVQVDAHMEDARTAVAAPQQHPVLWPASKSGSDADSLQGICSTTGPEPAVQDPLLLQPLSTLLLPGPCQHGGSLHATAGPSSSMRSVIAINPAGADGFVGIPTPAEALALPTAAFDPQPSEAGSGAASRGREGSGSGHGSAGVSGGDVSGVNDEYLLRRNALWCLVRLEAAMGQSAEDGRCAPVIK